MAELTATVLIDNIPADGLTGEWGLAFHIAYRGRNLLLDAGGSGAFADNADALGIDLSTVEYAALSHAHSDHSDGMTAFFGRNSAAPLLLRQGTAEDCCSQEPDGVEYIGIRPGMLAEYAHRIRFVSGNYEVCPGATLVPHTTPGLERIGAHARLFRLVDGELVPDDFSHEQSLVLETEKGLVIFSSCSHGGADNILREIADAFPGRQICALIGGFHLFESTRAEVMDFARRVRDTGIRTLITGHCTGQEAYDLLKEQLGDRISQLKTGFVLEV